MRYPASAIALSRAQRDLFGGGARQGLDIGEDLNAGSVHVSWRLCVLAVNCTARYVKLRSRARASASAWLKTLILAGK